MQDRSDITTLKERSSTEDKDGHIRFCLEKDVESSKSTGFERYDLINSSLPDMDYNDIDISCRFMGKDISAPFIVLPLTGGTETATEINRNLAKAAQELNVVMSVGSQRLGLENPALEATYQVRDVAPDVPLLANLGAIYLNYGYGLKECERAVQMIGADGLFLYLNPMQKVFQGTRNLNFKGLSGKIAHICGNLSVPVIVREVGFGLSSDVALQMKKAGASMLDISGAGGTSWVKVTRYLKEDSIKKFGSNFDDWGIPTVDSLIAVKEAVNDLPIIASGGIRNGIEIAKALALGASYAGMSLPLLSPAMESSEIVKKTIDNFIKEVKMAMFCCGVSNLRALRKGECIRKKEL
ncbi:MAG: type 2 isopentenyl-diphosphate Delta-isomerase [Deltaproteobacteria bacterium]|nr:type 2 isopentenyl-diphosphate Delta-isomerase [Deltaproteobacteria bacterium]